jgi:hypothetical protein
MIAFARVLKLTVACNIVLFAAISAIHMLPFDPADLRAILTPPDGCPTPCFIGIRPGVTNRDEALAILQSHGWAQKISQPNKYLYWYWRTHQPRFFSSQSEGAIHLSYDDRGQESPIVQSVIINTNIPIGYIYLLLGPNTNVYSGVIMDRVAVSIFYFDRYIKVSAVLSCPITYQKLWNAPMSIEFRNSLYPKSLLTPLNLGCT